MKTQLLSFLLVLASCAGRVVHATPAPDQSVKVRVAAYNVEFGSNATPEQIGNMFKPYKLDIIGFNEVPDGDWTGRVGKELGMNYSYVGKISSASTPITPSTETKRKSG